MISRRHFLVIAFGAAVMSQSLWSSDHQVRIMLDHLLLGCSDLDQGIAFVEKHTGVRPAMGGVHPGRGTRNALLALGAQHYLEVIAPDPAQTGIPTTRAELPAMLKRLTTPKLVDWAVHTPDIVGVAERLGKFGIAFQGPTPGSRARPDGRVLHWQTLNLDNDRDGLLPFFIEWGADTVHPSVDAPAGCRLESFAAVSPDSTALSAEFQRLGIEVQVEHGMKARLRTRIVGPGGEMGLG
jgi:catechol 2,3-dioxygenase-like lactoylglutathione lyase family enzyme